MTSNRTIATIQTATLTGSDATIVTLEVDIKAGLPSLQIVGMGNKAIDESRQRVRSAIYNSLLSFPARKVVVNLAPAELPKEGSHFDLPIAVGVLLATRQIQPTEVANALFAGELGLDGHIRPIRGVISIAEAAQKAGYTTLFVPSENAAQATLVQNIHIIGVHTLQSLYKHLRGFETLSECPPTLELSHNPSSTIVTVDSIIGQAKAKRALTIAVAGRHNILFTGPPGTGKTLLARSIQSILPELTKEEIVEVAKIQGLTASTSAITSIPPFRAPHHSLPVTALIGGGNRSRPGEISMAHKGVLFLDELPEFSKNTLESLRQPLEERIIHLSRLHSTNSYPCDVLFVATMNPCPCGYYMSSARTCVCTPRQIAAYTQRISGPLLDRIDLRLTIESEKIEHIFDTSKLLEKHHLEVLSYISAARKAQVIRYNRSSYYNTNATFSDVKLLFDVSKEARTFFSSAATRLALSSRSRLRILRVARTIADLENSPVVEQAHVAEALQFR
jgi:magnesium chelatase family protein